MVAPNYTNYTSALQDAYNASLDGAEWDDPGVYPLRDPSRIDYKFNLVPAYNEIMGQINGSVSDVNYRSATPWACAGSLNVGDPVYISGSNTVARASCTSSATLPVFGFIRAKPTPTTCIITHFYRLSDFATSSFTPAQVVYLQDSPGANGMYASSTGSTSVPIGWASSDTEIYVNAFPVNSSSGGGGVTGPIGIQGPVGIGYQGFTGIQGSSGAGYQGAIGPQGTPYAVGNLEANAMLTANATTYGKINSDGWQTTNTFNGVYNPAFILSPSISTAVFYEIESYLLFSTSGASSRPLIRFRVPNTGVVPTFTDLSIENSFTGPQMAQEIAAGNVGQGFEAAFNTTNAWTNGGDGYYYSPVLGADGHGCAWTTNPGPYINVGGSGTYNNNSGITPLKIKGTIGVIATSSPASALAMQWESSGGDTINLLAGSWVRVINAGGVGPAGALGPQGIPGIGITGPQGPWGGPQGPLGNTTLSAVINGTEQSIGYAFNNYLYLDPYLTLTGLTPTTNGYEFEGELVFYANLNSSLNPTASVKINSSASTYWAYSLTAEAIGVQGSIITAPTAYSFIWNGVTPQIAGPYSPYTLSNNTVDGYYNLPLNGSDINGGWTTYHLKGAINCTGALGSMSATNITLQWASGTTSSIYLKTGSWIRIIKPNDSGMVGAAGLQGIAGFNGAQGAFGLQGLKGPQGLLGSNGPQGLQGFGLQGQRGPVGIGVTGPAGAVGTYGPTGPTGSIGETGVQGDIGPQGPTANDGEIGAQGADGPQGLSGNDGVDGTQGNDGIIGPQGNDGIIGSQGNDGVQGIDGVQGNDGIGIQGNNGVQGNDGVQGIDGIIGPQGNDGVQGPYGGPRGIQGPIGPCGGPTGAAGSTGATGAIGPTGAMGPAGASITTYYASNTTGQEAYVMALGPDITYSAASGTGSFIVPTGSQILSARLRVPPSVQTSQNFTIYYGDNGSNGIMNQNAITQYPPIVQVWNESTGGIEVNTTALNSYGSITVYNLSAEVTSLIRIVF